MSIDNSAALRSLDQREPDDCEPIDNEIVKAAFAETWASPYELYRATYKYTACGPSVGMQIEYEKVEDDGFGVHASMQRRWLYCDDLRELGTWADLDTQGIPIMAISVSSIVEGVDSEVMPVEIKVDHDNDTGETLLARFETAVKDVAQQADDIWDMTHGCDDCGPENDDEYAGYRAINPYCSTCKGEGIII